MKRSLGIEVVVEGTGRMCGATDWSWRIKPSYSGG